MSAVMTDDLKWMFEHASGNTQNEIINKLNSEMFHDLLCYKQAVENGLYDVAEDLKAILYSEIRAALNADLNYVYTMRKIAIRVANVLNHDYHKFVYMRACLFYIEDKVTITFITEDNKTSGDNPGIFYGSSPASTKAKSIPEDSTDYYYCTIYLKDDGRLVF